MTDTAAGFWALFGVLLMVGIVYFLPDGCHGNCHQGRDQCDCKGKK